MQGKDEGKYLNHDVVAIAADENPSSGNSEGFLDCPAALVGGGERITDNLRSRIRIEQSQNMLFALLRMSSQNWQVVLAYGNRRLATRAFTGHLGCVRMLDTRRTETTSEVHVVRPGSTPRHASVVPGASLSFPLPSYLAEVGVSSLRSLVTQQAKRNG